jgi:hypothetical protein
MKLDIWKEVGFVIYFVFKSEDIIISSCDAYNCLQFSHDDNLTLTIHSEYDISTYYGIRSFS